VYAQATGGIGALTIQWEGMSNNPVARFTPLGPSVYRCVVNDLCGNVATDQVLVNTDFIEPSFNSVYLDDETIGLTNLLPDSLVTFWEFSDGTLSNDHHAEHRFNTLDEWVATLHAYTPLGCHNSVSQTFQATGEIYIPNAFSPNGDGLNDVYKPVGRDVLSYHLTIYNRFGQMVFETRDMEEYWTGGYLGGDYFVMDGLYSFILRATDARYNTIERNGMIQVMR
jgi:gliding motility-associated-like protein